MQDHHFLGHRADSNLEHQSKSCVHSSPRRQALWRSLSPQVYSPGSLLTTSLAQIKRNIRQCPLQQVICLGHFTQKPPEFRIQRFMNLPMLICWWFFWFPCCMIPVACCLA